MKQNLDYYFWKYLIIGLTFVISTVSWWGFPSLARAVNYNQKINQLRQKRQTLSREIIRNRRLAEAKKKEAKKISQELKTINGNIATTQKKINQLDEQIQAVRRQIEEKETAIRQKETELEKQEANRRNSLRAIYESTDESLIYILFSSNNISDIIDRSSYIEALEARIDKTIVMITQIKNDLTQQKEELKAKEEDLNGFKKQQEAYKKGLEYSKKRKNELLYQTKSIQKNYEKLVAEARRAYQNVNSELYRVMEAARKKARRGGTRKVNNIQFSWPFSGPVTTGFGVPTPVQSFHTGLDIDGVIGDPISAAADGKVIFAGGSKTYGYGYYIMIDHGSGIVSLYGHLSGFDTAVGETVKRGERIGFMGNTGFAIPMNGGDGSHLHFEIREDGVPVNPYLYLP